MITGIKYSLYLLLFLVLQLFVLDFVNFPLVPQTQFVIFFFFILILPRMSTLYLMLIAFGWGLIFDLFYRSVGIHAAACVLLAYIKDPVLKFFKDDEEDINYSVHLSYLGFGPFFFYTLLLSLIFHFVVTFLNDFTFADVFNNLLKLIMSASASVLLIYIFEILFFYRRQK